MSAFLQSGRFDWQETAVFGGRFRPEADIERCALFFRLYLGKVNMDNLPIAIDFPPGIDFGKDDCRFLADRISIFVRVT